MRQYNRVHLSSKTFINSLTSTVEYADAVRRTRCRSADCETSGTKARNRSVIPSIIR